MTTPPTETRSSWSDAAARAGVDRPDPLPGQLDDHGDPVATLAGRVAVVELLNGSTVTGAVLAVHAAGPVPGAPPSHIVMELDDGDGAGVLIIPWHAAAVVATRPAD